jgi:phospholipid-binding lipoprotein MlaA
VPVRNSFTVLEVIDTRAPAGVEQLLDQAALDPYSFQRDAFLQKRRNDIRDGEPPEEERYDLDEPPAK